MNYLLVGDFFFCFFLAALTSISLQKAKQDLIQSIEESFDKDKFFTQTRNSHIYFVAHEIIRFAYEPNKNFQYLKERLTSKSDKLIAQRKEMKKNIFNDAGSIFWILVLYVGIFKLGIQ